MRPLIVILLVGLLPAWAQQGGASPTEQLAIASLCPAERGQLAPESTAAAPVVRFGVFAVDPHQNTGFSTGFLHISRQRVWFVTGSYSYSFSTGQWQPSRPGAVPFDVARGEIHRAKPWTGLGKRLGWAEIQTEARGKWTFHQVQCTAIANGEKLELSDPRNFQDILDAINDFENALERVTALDEPRRQAEAKAKQEAETKAKQEAEAKTKQEAEAKAAREAAEQAKTATLRITAQPGGAQVYLDDKFKGVTSEGEGVLVIEGLHPANYRVRISATGYKDWTDSAVLAGGETRNLEARLLQAGPKPLSIEEVEEALRNGISTQRVQGFVKQFGVDFTLSDEVERRLRADGADSDLLLTITKARK